MNDENKLLLIRQLKLIHMLLSLKKNSRIKVNDPICDRNNLNEHLVCSQDDHSRDSHGNILCPFSKMKDCNKGNFEQWYQENKKYLMLDSLYKNNT